MIIAPIAELGNIVNPVQNNAPARGGAPKADFKDAFQNAADSIQPVENGRAPAMTDGTGAKGTDSNTAKQMAQKPQDTQREPAGAAGKAEDTKAVRETEARPAEGQEAEDASKTELTPEQEEQLGKAASKLLKEAAEQLDIPEEELAELLSELGLGAGAFLDPQNINVIVAQVKGDGDMMSLVTDSALSDIAEQLKQLVGEATAEVREQLPELTEEAQQAVFAEALESAELTPEEGAAAASVSDLVSKAIDAPQREEPAAAPVIDAGNGAGENAELSVAQIGEDTPQKGNVDTGRKEERHEFHEELSGRESFAAQLTPETGAEQIAEAARPELTPEYVTNPQELLEQVQGQIRANVSEDVTSLDLVLHPASLGNVALRVESQNGQVTAQFTAQNESVREALEAQVMILKENLEQQGVKVEAVEVTVASHAFEENLQQGDNSEGEAEAEERERLRRATHRINLGDYAGEGMEGVEDADALTVEMMQADGQQLDYRA